MFIVGLVFLVIPITIFGLIVIAGFVIALIGLMFGVDKEPDELPKPDLSEYLRKLKEDGIIDSYKIKH
jgi:hypothetical protein